MKPYPISYMVEPFPDDFSPLYRKNWKNKEELTAARKRFFMVGTKIPSIMAFSTILVYYG